MKIHRLCAAQEQLRQKKIEMAPQIEIITAASAAMIAAQEEYDSALRPYIAARNSAQEEQNRTLGPWVNYDGQLYHRRYLLAEYGDDGGSFGQAMAWVRMMNHADFGSPPDRKPTIDYRMPTGLSIKRTVLEFPFTTEEYLQQADTLLVSVGWILYDGDTSEDIG